MTIKQQGGIFGRNPTFNDVTVEGTLTTSGAQSFEELNVDNINIDGNTISSTDANGNVILDPNGTGITKVERTLLVNTDAGTNESRLVSIRVNGTDREIFAHEPGGNARPLVLRTQELTFRNDAAVHATFNTSGNLAFSSGKGIDFSATSGTGTSELFDDYEEGTFEPALKSATTTVYATQLGRYTKVGNMVYCHVRLEITTLGDGDPNEIVGFPFTADTTDDNGHHASFGYYSSAVDVIALYSNLAGTTMEVMASSAAAATPSNPANVFGDDRRLDFSIAYRAS